MKHSLRERWRRIRFDPTLQEWLPAGLLGGFSGGASVAWLLWGWPNVPERGICFVFWGPLAVALFAIACAMGISLVFFGRRLVKGIKRLTTPPSIAMWEPMEPMPELDILSWPHPGCGLVMYVPLLLISAFCSLIWFYLGFSQVQWWRMVLLMVVGLPFGMMMARKEGQLWRASDESMTR